ncbi:MAG: TetR family transcriptional regulator [Myxococcota bacterium]
MIQFSERRIDSIRVERRVGTAGGAGVETGGDTREAILLAALQAFAENGFEGTSTRDIVTRAGVNHGLIRYYFGGKAKLWRKAVDRAFAELGRGVTSVMGDESIVDDRERIGQLVRGYVRFVARNPEFVRLMHEEGKRRGPRMRWMVDRHVRPLYEAMSTLLSRAEGVGVPRRSVSAVHFFYIVAGAVGVIYHQAEECRRLSGIDPFEDSAIEAHAQIVEHLLLGLLEGEEHHPGVAP